MEQLEKEFNKLISALNAQTKPETVIYNSRDYDQLLNEIDTWKRDRHASDNDSIPVRISSFRPQPQTAPNRFSHKRSLSHSSQISARLSYQSFSPPVNYRSLKSASNLRKSKLEENENRIESLLSVSSFDTSDEPLLTAPGSPIMPPTKMNADDNVSDVSDLINDLNDIIQDVPTKMTRIYIDDNRQFKTIQLSHSTTAKQVVEIVSHKALLDPSVDWTLFELFNDLGMERPMRDWEIVSQTLQGWELPSENALMVRKYAFRDSLIADNIRNDYPRMYGWLNYYNSRKRKWNKRFFEIKGKTVFHYKDAKGNDEVFMCTLTGIDVYTCITPPRGAPTKFCFALKSTSKKSLFENVHDYSHIMCADHAEKLKDWVLSIRNVKNLSTLEIEENSNRKVSPSNGPLLEFQVKEKKTGKLIDAIDQAKEKKAMKDRKGKKLLSFDENELVNK